LYSFVTSPRLFITSLYKLVTSFFKCVVYLLYFNTVLLCCRISLYK
jgi:hypothetical protein